MTTEEKRAYDRARYAKNREKRLEQARALYAAPGGELKAQKLAYRAANKEKIAAQRRAYEAANKEKIAAYTAANRERFVENARRRVYGLPAGRYREIFEQQQGLCAMEGCTRAAKDIDHCHETGRLRGLLCPVHNRALGLFGDNIEGLKKAIAYLERSEQANV